MENEDPLKKMVEQRDAQRLLLLRKAFETTGGLSGRHSLNGEELGRAIGFDRETTRAAIDHLCGQGLLKHAGTGLTVALTHKGCCEVEESIRKPYVGTEHFSSAVISITNHFNAPVAAVQTGNQNTANAALEASAAKHQELLQRLDELRARATTLTPREDEGVLSKQEDQMLKAFLTVTGIKDDDGLVTSLVTLMKAASKR